jgi:hypothetical protein
VAADETSCPSISSAWACALSAMDILTLQLERHLSALRRGVQWTQRRVLFQND